jgi:hypothetical protein
MNVFGGFIGLQPRNDNILYIWYHFLVQGLKLLFLESNYTNVHVGQDK